MLEASSSLYYMKRCKCALHYELCTHPVQHCACIFSRCWNILLVLPSLTGTIFLMQSLHRGWIFSRKTLFRYFQMSMYRCDNLLRCKSSLLLPRKAAEPEITFLVDQSQSSKFTSRRVDAMCSRDFFWEVCVRRHRSVNVELLPTAAYQHNDWGINQASLLFTPLESVREIYLKCVRETWFLF